MIKGNLVKEYNGVKIYITTEGRFFCDCISNSSEFSKKTFDSEKLQSIEKAIYNFEGASVDESYYLLSMYPLSVNKLIAKSKVGNRILFTDGTKSDDWNRRGVKKASLIEDKEEFKKLLNLAELYKELNDEIAELTKQQRDLAVRGKELIDKL
jgi:hypothetical protein